MYGSRSARRWLPLVALLVASTGWMDHAVAQQRREPLVVLGLRPAAGNLDGPTETGRLFEAKQLRAMADETVRVLTNRAIVDDTGLRKVLGNKYTTGFLRCRSQPACVVRVLSKMKKTASMAVYGEYVVLRKIYRFRFQLVNIAQGKVVKQLEFSLKAKFSDDHDAWERELAPLLRTEIASATPVVAIAPNPPSDASEPPEPPAPSEPSESDAATPEPVPELAPIVTADVTATADPATTSDAKPDDAFINDSVLDAISRGITWHGHFQNYTAVATRGTFRGDVITFEDRLQLEFESDLNRVRVVGKPQLVYDVLAEDLSVRFRELYARREFEKFDLSVGEQILTWGVTDFWPVVDILSPRDYRSIRNWRPIDEKLPVPMLQSTLQFGRLSIQLVGVPVLRGSRYEIDQTRPFAIPVPAPPGTIVEQVTPPRTIWNAGGGARIELAVAGWKLALYGLVGRDPLPAIHAQIDLPNPTRFIVDNDRVAMAATSVQGKIAPLGVLLRAEAAGYHRLNDDCKGQDDIVFGTPECFYLRRVPTARTNLSFERRILPGLDAHLQFISELTRKSAIPALPQTAGIIAPGLPEQYPWNRIFTLRLQGDYLKSDFRPMLFAYWSIDDEAFFVNTDFEYHVADGLALSLGAFWFHGYAEDPNKNRFTLAGAFEQSSNLYMRATAWF